jgi:hypothetical protein
MTKPYCYHTPAEVRESGLLSGRIDAIEAEIESRISEPRTADGKVITSAKLAAFPDGTLLLYPRMDHDPEGRYIRRELMAAVLTPDELKLVNDHCLSAQSAARDLARLEKATKLDHWDGWVTDGDGFWDSVESYLDEKGDEIETGAEEAVPLYLWVAVPQQVVPHLDVAGVVEHWIDDRGWEDCDLGAFEGVETLQAALDAFVQANAKVVSYSSDYTRAVMLNSYLAHDPR